MELVRSRVESYAQLAWVGLGSYRDADIDRLVGLIVPKVLAGQRQIANLTDGYLAALGGARAGVEPKLVTGAAVRNGAEPEDVYRRPAKTLYTKLSEGMAYSNAEAEGFRRLQSLVSTDMQLAMRAQEDRSLRAGGWKFFKRVLTGSENCAKCAIASTQRYRVGNLKPIHPGCDCTCEPLKTMTDPGQVIDENLLESIHELVGNELGLDENTVDRGARDLGLGKTDAKGNAISDYTDLIVTRNHGEYGPTLTWRKDKFTSAAGLA